MKAKPPEDETPGGLQPDLRRKLDTVGPDHYAKATAGDFAKGGKYNATPKKPKYALT